MSTRCACVLFEADAPTRIPRRPTGHTARQRCMYETGALVDAPGMGRESHFGRTCRRSLPSTLAWAPLSSHSACSCGRCRSVPIDHSIRVRRKVDICRPTRACGLRLMQRQQPGLLLLLWCVALVCACMDRAHARTPAAYAMGEMLREDSCTPIGTSLSPQEACSFVHDHLSLIHI